MQKKANLSTTGRAILIVKKGDIVPYDGVLVGGALYSEMILRLAEADAEDWTP